MPAWQYKVEYGPGDLTSLQSRCNRLGKEGWELAGMTPEITKLKNGKPIFYLVFKRAAKEKT